jgi:hypothetical protein
MDQKELMAKAAQAIRQLEAENKGLRAKLGSLEKTANFAQTLSQQVEAAKVVLQLVNDGETDPGDALDKFAEVCSLNQTQIAELLRKDDAEKIGHIKSDSVGVGDGNPLLSYLLSSR